MNGLTEYLFPEPAPRTPVAIYGWWERRRLSYNLIVGGSGVVSLGFVRLITMLPPDPRWEFIPLAAVVVFGVAANICFLLGPAAEIAIEKLWGRRVLPTGPTLFRMGLTFSVGLAFLPTLFAGFDLAVRILRALF